MHNCQRVATDIPLTSTEALSIADQLDDWPPGLGYVLARDDSRKRGWRRHPDFDLYHRRPVPKPGPDVKHCPVIQLTEARGLHSYSHHLSAWRTLRDAVADTTGLELEESHQLYNELLRTDPGHLASLYRGYAV